MQKRVFMRNFIHKSLNQHPKPASCIRCSCKFAYLRVNLLVNALIKNLSDDFRLEVELGLGAIPGALLDAFLRRLDRGIHS